MARVIGLDTSLTGTGMMVVQRSASDATLSGWRATPRLITTTKKADGFADIHRRVKDITRVIDMELALLPTLVVMEAPAFAMRASSHQHSTAWLWGAVYGACVNRGIPVLTPTSNQRMQYATGKGNADKDVVLAAAIKRWSTVDIVNNNIADAMVFAAIGCRALGIPIDDVPPTHYISKKNGNWMEKLAA